MSDAGCLAQAESAQARGESWRATAILREGCERDRDLGCCEGAARAIVDEAPVDDVEALLEPICDRDHIDGCLRAGDVLAPLAPTRATPFYLRACQDAYGEFQGCGHRRQGVCAVEIAREPAVCRQAVERLAELGQDEEARKAAYAVCQSSEASGCGLLGEFLASGRGRSGLRDLDGAHEVMQRACRAGDEAACARAQEVHQEIEDQARVAQCEDVPEALRTSRMDKADVRIGPFEASGIDFCSMACQVAGEPGGLDTLLIGPLAATGMSERRSKLADCGKTGQPIRLRWKVYDGRMAEVDAEGEDALAQCVEQALRDVPTPFVGQCVGTMRLP